MANAAIKVLVVDDSAVIRRILSKALADAPGIDVVGGAADPYEARDKIVSLKPDVLTLDIEMPRMDGLTFLAKLMESYPIPVVMVSTLTIEGSEMAVRALELGAIDVVCKPSDSASLKSACEIVVDRVRVASRAKVRQKKPAGALRTTRPTHRSSPFTSDSKNRILAIGASTGGTEAIRTILERLPATTPGTVITLHMPALFTAAFANRLDSLCAMSVREAQHRDRIVQGVALLAPGGRHMVVSGRKGNYSVELNEDPLVHFQRPAVDPLFESVAANVGRDAVGVLLTGMGADGAEGLLAMRASGAHTLAQDEASCVVFGMPKEAIRIGAASEVVPLEALDERIMQRLSAPAASRRARP